MEINTITAEKLQSLGTDAALIDVRTPKEFREAHIPHAINVPLDQITAEIVREHASTGPVYIVCQAGKRSENACKKLIESGYKDVVTVIGGTNAWREAGYQVSQGEKAISLDRQMRITAGSLVLIGIVCGLTLHSGFLFLSAFVGAGLIFSGVTDTCGMISVLSKMPWNQ